MAFIKFKSYGRGHGQYVNSDRVVSFSQIDQGSNYGTEIKMDDGSRIHVGDWPSDVEKLLNAANEIILKDEK